MNIMGEERKDYVAVLKRTLRPDRWKIVLFIIFILALMMLPLFPTGREILVNYHDYENKEIIMNNKTSVHSLYDILVEDFEWEGSPYFIRVEASFHMADIVFLSLYVPYSILAYFIACYLVQRFRGGGKGKEKSDVSSRKRRKGC
jgi:hypothetical protein